MSKKFHFAKAFEETEKIVADLESNTVDIDKGLELYEKGLGLIGQCREYLKAVENKVETLKIQFQEKNEKVD